MQVGPYWELDLRVDDNAIVEFGPVSGLALETLGAANNQISHAHSLVN